MQAIWFERLGGPDVLEVRDVPDPVLGDGEVLVNVEAVGVNYRDVYERTREHYGVDPPGVIGAEAGGTSAEGERLVWNAVPHSYAEKVAVPRTQAVVVPDGVATDLAVAVLLQGMTAHYLCYSTYPVKAGDTVLVHAAAGGVGLLLVQMCHNLGARVIGTVSTEEKAKLAREAGADEVILYTQSDFETETKRLTDGKGVNVVYDSVGKTTFDKGLNILKPRGMMVLFGGSSGAVPPFDPIVLSTKGSLFVTRPTLGHYTATREELESRASAVFSMISAGKLKLRIEHTYPLAQAQQAHRDLEGRKTTGKLLLLP